MRNADLPAQPSATGLALCVDLDGTLIHGDLLLESFLLLIRRNPLYLLWVPLWLMRGKATLKSEIARRVNLNAATLPYNQPLIDWLRGQHQAGRALWLCTASNGRLADAVAAHLAIFDGVIASDERANLSGRAKAEALVARFGEAAFEYCGNHAVDLEIWRRSAGAIVVNGRPELAGQAAGVTRVVSRFPARRHAWTAWARAARLHQWAKNLLIFVPLLAAHRAGDLGMLRDAMLAFLAFGACASSVYLLNDMLDLEADRQHPRKSRRPFASGELSLLAGLVAAPILILAAIALAGWLPTRFRLALAVYYLITLAYSFGLKRVVIVDALTLAALYTLRLIAGAGATNVSLSFWMLLFAVFLFLSLALVKRYAELDALRRRGSLKATGRGYHVDDLPVLQNLGAASGYLCVLVLALYIHSPEVHVMYGRPQAIWFLCVLMLFWISRVWLKTHRGQMHDDPVVFALRDPASLAVGALGALTVAVAT